MERMAEVVPGVLHGVLSLVEEMEEEEEMVGIGVVGSMLVDWTDARKLVVQDEAFVGWDEAGRRETKAVNGDIHLGLAETLLEKLMGHGCTSMSSICSFLDKYLSENRRREEVYQSFVWKTIYKCQLFERKASHRPGSFGRSLGYENCH